MAQGQYEAMKAGEDMYNSRVNQTLAMRNSFFGGEGALAQGANQANLSNQSNIANIYAQSGQNKNQLAFNAWDAANKNNLAGAQFNWNKQTDLWNRDNDLYNRAASERTYKTGQTEARSQALAGGGDGIVAGVRSLF